MMDERYSRQTVIPEIGRQARPDYIRRVCWSSARRAWLTHLALSGSRWRRRAGIADMTALRL
jgi:hypothetical protein